MNSLRLASLLLALALVPACLSNFGPAPIENVAWRLVELFGEKVAVPEGAEAPSLRFDGASQTVSGSTGVNRINGGYLLDGDALHFGALASTRRAGPPELMELETRFLKALERTQSTRLDGNTLELREGDTVLARLEH